MLTATWRRGAVVKSVPRATTHVASGLAQRFQQIATAKRRLRCQVRVAAKPAGSRCRLPSPIREDRSSSPPGEGQSSLDTPRLVLSHVEAGFVVTAGEVTESDAAVFGQHAFSLYDAERELRESLEWAGGAVRDALVTTFALCSVAPRTPALQALHPASVATESGCEAAEKLDGTDAPVTFQPRASSQDVTPCEARAVENSAVRGEFVHSLEAVLPGAVSGNGTRWFVLGAIVLLLMAVTASVGAALVWYRRSVAAERAIARCDDLRAVTCAGRHAECACPRPGSCWAGASEHTREWETVGCGVQQVRSQHGNVGTAGTTPGATRWQINALRLWRVRVCIGVHATPL